MTILIAGGSGFYGINTARCLADQGHEVLMLQRHLLTRPPALLEPYWGREIKQYAGDLLDFPVLMGTVDGFGVESIIHAAALPAGSDHDPRTHPLHPMLRVQIEGCMNCLEVARLAGLRRVTFASSVDVYRGWPHPCEVWDEEAFLPPVAFSEIGNVKRAVEQVGFLYSRVYEISFVALRIAGNYGVAAFHPINTMIDAAREGVTADLSAMAPGRRTHPVFAKDSALATCFTHLAPVLQHQIYNVSDGTHPTYAEIADSVKQVLPEAEIKLGDSAGDDGRSDYHPQPVDRMREEFGFEPAPLADGVRQHVRYLEDGEY